MVKGLLYTIEIDWENKVVILNLPEIKEKIVIIEKDARSISNCFKLLKIKE